jgi:hypothetical protein
VTAALLRRAFQQDHSIPDGARDLLADVALDALAESCGGRFVDHPRLGRVEVG